MTATVPIALFLPYVLPDVPGCPNPMVTAHIVVAAVEFCRRTRYWRETLSPINTVAGQGTYLLVPPANAAIDEILSVRHNGHLLGPVTTKALDGQYPDLRWDTMTGQPTHYAADEVDNIILFPVPSVAGSLLVTCVLKPSVLATTLPKFFFDHYLTALSAGAKARLMAIPGKPWTNPEASAYNMSIFEAAMPSAMTLADKGFNRSRMRVTARFF